jgi:hypothetical protein
LASVARQEQGVSAVSLAPVARQASVLEADFELRLFLDLEQGTTPLVQKLEPVEQESHALEREAVDAPVESGDLRQELMGVSAESGVLQQEPAPA